MRKLIAVSAAALAATAMLATPALAQTAGSADASDVELYSADAHDLADAAAPGEAQDNEPVVSDAVAEHLDKQARDGRLVDVQSVAAADLGDLVVVWEDGVAIEQVDFATELGPNGSVDQEIAVETSPESTGADGNVEPTGFGLAGVGSYSGGVFKGGNCYTTSTTTVNATKNTVTGCWEKFKVSQSTSTRDYWYYGRWATANGGSGTSTKPAYIDIRSRPWKGTTAIASLVNYWPKSSSNVCNASGTSAQFAYAGFQATIPVQECSGVSPIPNATEKRMGVIWDDGAWYASKTKGTEFGMAVATYKGAIPNLADYNYVKFCNGNTGCTNPHGNLRKDSGW